MLTPLEAYRRVLRNDPTFKLEGGVDYDHEYYVFTGPLDMYAVDKRLGTVVAFVPTTNMEKYFDAVKNRSLNIGSFQHSDNDESYLEHFGIKNMKWGVRRFQNKDGSLTDAGKKRYSKAGENVVGGGGGGAPEEEDEETKKKIEEAAKKAGMTVDEFRKKFANKVAAIKKAAYDAAGGKYKDAADKYDAKAKNNRNLASEYRNASLDSYVMGMAYDQAAKRRYAASEARKEAVKNEKPINYERPDDAHSPFPSETAIEDRKAQRRIKYHGTPDIYGGVLPGKKTKARWGQEYAASSKKEFDDWASGKAKLTGKGAEYWFHRERAATLRRKHSGTIGSGDKRIGDAYTEEAARQRETGSAQAREAARYDDKANESSKKARSYRKKYEKSLLGRYDRVKSKIERKRKSQQGIKQGEKHEGLRTHTLPKMKSLTATAKPMRKLTSKELSKIRSEAKKRRK